MNLLYLIKEAKSSKSGIYETKVFGIPVTCYINEFNDVLFKFPEDDFVHWHLLPDYTYTQVIEKIKLWT